MAKVIAYEVQVNGLNVAIKNQDDLQAAIKQTDKLYKSADFGSEAAQKAAKELDKLKAIQANLRKERRDAVNQERANVSQQQGYYRQQQAQLVKLKNEYKDLTKEELEAFGPSIQKQVRALSDELKDLDKGLGDNFRNVGNYSGGITDAFAQLGGIDLAALATVPGAIVAIGTAAISAGQYVFELTEEFRQLRGEIQTLTGATGDDLDSFTARIAAIGDTFEESQTDILNAANSVSTQLEIPFSEALDKIEEGFIAGSNQTGEFLDNLREYPAFFKEAELGADALFQVLNKQAKEGIYSDKGVDVIKEVTLRLRENATATAAALNGIGLESEKVQKQIAEEGIGAAIATVAKQLSTLRADSPEVGAAIADIFGGPGEDAGLQFITSLQNINKETGSLIDQSNEYQLQQQRALEINKEFAEVQNEVAKELGGAGAEFSNLGTIIETKALKFLLFFVEQLKVLGNIFKPLVDAFAPLLRSLGSFSEEASAAEVIAKSLAKGFEIVTTPVRLLIGLVGKFVTGLSDAIDTGRGFLEWLGIVEKEAKKSGGGINTLPGAMEGFGKKTKEATEEQKKQTEAIKDNVVTIDSLKDKLKELKEQRDKTKIGSDEFKRLDKEILALEKTLSKYGSATKRAAVATDQFAKGSIAQLKKEVSDLQKELNEAAPENTQGVLEKLVGAEKALEQVEKAREELRNRLVAGNREFSLLDDRVTLLNPDQIKQQTEPYKKEFEKISEDLGDKQVEAQKKAAEETIRIQEETAQAIRDIQSEIFSGIGDVLGNLGEASQTRYDNELSALEERYELESEAAGRNARERVRLEEQYERERARLEEKAFEQQKKYRKAAVLASLAEGIVNILSAPTTIPQPFAAAYKAVRIGLLTLTSSQQIANINAQQAAEGTIIEMAKGGLLTGATHMDPSGGIPLTLNGKHIRAEHGEFLDVAEDGALAIINKRSTALHRNKLQAAHGRIWPGKKQWLSAINSDKNFGVRFAQSGAILQPEVASVLSGQTGGAQVSIRSIEISDRSVNKIAASTAAAVEYGARRGTALGASDSTKRIEREERLRRRTGV